VHTEFVIKFRTERSVARSRCRWNDDTKCVWGVGLCTGYGPAAGCCEDGRELSVFMRGGGEDCLNWVVDYQHLAPRSDPVDPLETPINLN
jgi:hypothetical protein